MTARHPAVRAVTLATATAAAMSVAMAQQGPSFRARVDLLTIDVRVLDREGRPIRGLRPEEFQVDVDGQRRPVQVMDYVEFGFARTTSTPLIDPPYQLPGAEAAGRSILFAFDDMSFRRDQATAMLAQIDEWLAKLDPRDAVAVGTTSGLGPPSQFLTNRAVTSAQLRALFGRRDRTGPVTVWAVVSIEEARAFTECTLGPDGELKSCSELAIEIFSRECGASDDQRGCYSALSSEAARVRQESERETVQQIGGLVDLVHGLARAPAPRVLVLLSRGLPLERLTDLAELGRAAMTAGVAVYVLASPGSPAEAELPMKLSPVGLMPDEALRRDDALSLAGIETVAGVTNGRSQQVVGSAQRFLDRILTETSGYYRLGVEPSAAGGDWMTLKVAARRSGSSAHAPSRIARPGANPEPVKTESMEERLSAVVRRGGLLRGLPVELTTTLGRDARAERLQVTANVRLRDQAPEPQLALFVLLAQDGRLAAQGQFALLPRRNGPGFQAAFHVPVLPGRYLLRVGVGAAGGDIGLAEQEVVARLPRMGSYFASDLIVAWAGSDGQLHYPELDEVPGSAVSVRPLLELYATEGRPTVVPRVRLEFQPVVGGTGLTRELDVTVGGTLARARADVPVGDLIPGEYTLRAVIFEGDREAGAVTTRLRISPPASPR